MRILGVDPGLNITGYGVVEHNAGVTTLVEGGVIRSEPSGSLEARLSQIAAEIRQVLRQLEPEVMVVEELYAKYRHPQTAILMGHARGVVLLEAAQKGLVVAAYPASLVKRALVGHGRASKEQVGTMVAHLLGLAQTPQPDDVTDALALCLCHLSPLRWQQQTRALPSEVVEALGKHRSRPRRRRSLR